MNKVKQTYLKLTLALAAVASTLSASDDLVLSGERIDACCCTPSCCKSGQFFIRGDALYWTPRATGLELNFGSASIAETVTDCTQIFATEEVDLDPHYKWDAGYRVGAGYVGCNTGIEALWTHFQGKGTRNDSEDVDLYFGRSGRVNFKLDQIDVVLAYNSDPEGSFNLKPFFGIRGTKIDEHLHAFLVTDISLPLAETAIETRIFNDKQKYWGVGPLFGLQGDWNIAGGFGIYGTAAASLLYGEYKVHLDDIDIFTAPVSKQIFSNTKQHVHSFDWNVDLALGFSWHTQICDKFEIDMRLGFEHHQYFDQNRLAVGRGDVSFTGGVFSLGIGF